MTKNQREVSLFGSLLGTALGDAFGLLREGLSPERAAKLYGEPRDLQFGFCSDDTEHACWTAQSLLQSAAGATLSTRFHAQRFQISLARELKIGICAFPAGTGLATLRASLRLLRGVSPEKSGVMSAGNGAAMRAAILGVACDDTSELRVLNRISSRLTHLDARAEMGAFAIALAAHLNARRGDKNISVLSDNFLQTLSTQRFDGERETFEELKTLMEGAAHSAGRGESTSQFAQEMGWQNGVSGFVMRSVPAALHAWLRYDRDLRAALIELVRCGGDTDTTAALAGGVIGASLAREDFPADWLNALREKPRDAAHLEKLARALAMTLEERRVLSEAERRALSPSFGAMLGRNSVFFARVMAHGFRRLLPPYAYCRLIKNCRAISYSERYRRTARVSKPLCLQRNFAETSGLLTRAVQSSPACAGMTEIVRRCVL